MLSLSQLQILRMIGAECNVVIDEHIEAGLRVFIDELKIWNKKINLISQHDTGRIFDKHIVESLAILMAVNIPDGAVVLDIGSGAGFPGIPVSVLRPDIQMFLVESKRKKAGFLQHIVSELQMTHVTVINDRVENISRNQFLNNKIDFVTARAVAELEKLYNWALPFLTNDGKLLALKGERDKKEMKKSKQLNTILYDVILIENEIIHKERELVLFNISK